MSDDAHTYTIKLNMFGDGTMSLSERGKKDDSGLYASTPLLTYGTEASDIELQLYVTNDAGEDEEPPEHIRLSLHTSHVQNPETGRIFNTSVNYRLQPVEANRLRDWLDLVLKHHQKPSAS